MLLCLGLLVHMGKVKFSDLVRGYCGFEYDLKGLPQMLLPTDKVDPHPQSKGQEFPIFCLALVVVTGTLQSLDPVTPGNMGASYLRSLTILLMLESITCLKLCK
eukprot:3757426-Ditylum_brightwellii.AAC.1